MHSCVSDTAVDLQVYRVFVVWKRNYLVALIPFLLVLAGFGTGGYVVYRLDYAIPEHGIEAYLKIGPAFGYWLYPSLAANILGTGMCTVVYLLFSHTPVQS